jgi:DNA-binding protein HU-beta
MNHTDLVNKIAEVAKVTKADAIKVLDATAQIVVEAAKTGEEVRIAGLGVFDGVSREARSGRNPSTGEAITIAASKALRFRAGKVVKDQLNTPSPQKAPVAKSKSKVKSTGSGAAA